jgi:hypothetical protein
VTIAPVQAAARRGSKKWKPAEKVSAEDIKVLMKLVRSFKKQWRTTEKNSGTLGWPGVI